MRADDDVAYLAFKLRMTAPDGLVVEGGCVAMDSRVDPDRVRHIIIDLVRTSAGQWEFASTEAS